MLERIPVLYHPDMVVEDNPSFSPSAGKPKQVVAAWKRAGLPIEVIESKPVSQADLCLVHDPEYVDGVMTQTVQNGFGNTHPAVAYSTRFTVGSMFDAAKRAIKNGKVAVSPTSGFHHACYAWGGGFCTFNGLMVAAYKVLLETKVEHLLIVDCDYHYGNGTDDILDELTPTMRQRIAHFTTGSKHTSAGQAEDFLDSFPDLLRSLAKPSTGLILYQAGADAHIDDPLGGWMTTAQLRQRDAILFEFADSKGIPVAWNLAGGYQRDEDNSIEPVLKIHTNTMKECCARYILR